MGIRSYWIPGSYAPALSENRNSFLRLLKNKGFKDERMTKVGLYAIGTSTTLESNKSLKGYTIPLARTHGVGWTPASGGGLRPCRARAWAQPPQAPRLARRGGPHSP